MIFEAHIEGKLYRVLDVESGESQIVPLQKKYRITRSGGNGSINLACFNMVLVGGKEMNIDPFPEILCSLTREDLLKLQSEISFWLAQ